MDSVQDTSLIAEINIFSDFECFRKNSVKPSKTTVKPINYSAFESRNVELSNQIQSSKIEISDENETFLIGGA